MIGQAPRHLDRNIALVGRVIEGMPVLAALRRGTGSLGFYDDLVRPAGGVDVCNVPVSIRPAPWHSGQAVQSGSWYRSL